MGFRLIAGIAAFWVLVFYIPYSRFASHPPAQQAPWVTAPYEPANAVERQHSASEAPTTIKGASEAEDANGRQETSEFWSILGHKLKITDSLLVLFTFLVWWATRGLVVGGENTAKRQLRAYVSINPQILYNFGSADDIRIECKTENHGQTPAFNLTHVFAIDVLPSLLPQGFVFAEPRTRLDANSAVFPKSSIKTWFNRQGPITAAQVTAIEAGTHNLHLWGASSYVDAFGDRQTTQFNVSLDLGTFIYSRNEIRAGRRDPGFNWEYGDRHNQAT
jgi:hypothetical protein